MDQESDLLLNKCDRGVDGGVDRISRLPDEIIVHILCFLTLKKAVATSVLSSRWLDFWKHIPYLNFDRYILPVHDFNIDDDAQRCKCKKIVNSVIQSHKAIFLKTFKLLLPVRKSDQSTVTKWLEFVFSRQVEYLQLSTIRHEEDDMIVLEELLRESRVHLQPQTDLIFFQSLKELCLTYLKVSGEDIELFLHKCPLLEHLTIGFGTLTSDIEVCGENLLLKHLNIVGCTGEKSIKVSAPNLTYTRFAALDEREGMLFENVPKLVEVEFIFLSPDIVEQRFASLASCYFSQLQILNLTLYASMLHILLANGFTQMPNLKKLVILCLGTIKHSLVRVASVIWTYPRLEEFKLTLVDRREGQLPSQVMTDVGRSPHQHLKVFELQMSPRQNMSDDIVELVTYISNKCIALQKMIIDHQFTPIDPATRDLIAQRLQGKVPNHIQLELFNSRL